jgi:hypothetical protein
MIYIINRERLLDEYHSLKERQRGSFNWFISPEGILHIFIDREGVTYLYRGDIINEDAVVKDMLSKRFSVLGAAGKEDGLDG